jgi:mRNA deadenylase 3'-5' endonuclease subunit Ccr4
VRPAPNLPLRAMVALPPPPGTPPSGSRFTLMTYNLLADLYAKVGGWRVWGGGFKDNRIGDT